MLMVGAPSTGGASALAGCSASRLDWSPVVSQTRTPPSAAVDVEAARREASDTSRLANRSGIRLVRMRARFPFGRGSTLGPRTGRNRRGRRESEDAAPLL